MTNKISLLGYTYVRKEFDERLAKTIHQRFELPEIVCDLLSSRNVALGEVDNFIDPKIKTSLPDPFLLGDMNKGVNFVVGAIKNKKKITIFADYDVDGATSAAILKRFFRQIGVEADIYIPDRILEGYGPNKEAMLKLKEQGTDLVITLDCGTVAFEPLEVARGVGLDVIVIDHHLGVVKRPDAIAVINPNNLDEKFEHKNLCAAGVTFLFVVAINKTLRDMGFYERVREPNLISLLDLVALGTVCDVMSLTGLNRAFVSAGLKVLRQRKNMGLRVICDKAGLDEEPNAYHFGFVIGPRINAGGRVGTSNLGAEILSSQDEARVEEIADKLEKFNQERKDIEAAVLEEAKLGLEEGLGGYSKNDDVVFAVGKNWHPGVIGIVASRLKDLYEKPVAVVTIDEKTKKAKASCRSISGIDMGAEILHARAEEIILEGGGHAMAGGFSIDVDKIKNLHAFFNKRLTQKVQSIRQERKREFDVSVSLSQVNLEMLKQLNKLEPFGVGNQKPKFILRDVKKLNAKIIGKTAEHVSATFSSKAVIGFNGAISVVAFKVVDNEVGKMLLDEKYKKEVDLVGTFNINSWMGNDKVQMIVEDILI
ncbi:MAG: single-stranded-DNA-specific exonuclease RecJ [Rickettsiales bacterium]|nr:single-stranded-DNA-specific exonuclease RecJ [Rickettsiales bacterium]